MASPQRGCRLLCGVLAWRWADPVDSCLRALSPVVARYRQLDIDDNNVRWRRHHDETAAGHDAMAGFGRALLVLLCVLPSVRTVHDGLCSRDEGEKHGGDSPRNLECGGLVAAARLRPSSIN